MNEELDALGQEVGGTSGGVFDVGEDLRVRWVMSKSPTDRRSSCPTVMPG